MTRSGSTTMWLQNGVLKLMHLAWNINTMITRSNPFVVYRLIIYLHKSTVRLSNRPGGKFFFYWPTIALPSLPRFEKHAEINGDIINHQQNISCETRKQNI